MVIDSRLAACSNADGCGEPSPQQQFDAIVIGAGIGGLVTATQLATKGARVLVLERYLIPGGSAGWFERQGYRFDVGASMIFGFGDRGTTNLLTRALDAVGMALETIPDPVQIHYHLPQNLTLKVHQDYEHFLQELIARFPQEAVGIRRFYNECWRVFDCLNRMELLSLEEVGYLTRMFVQHPLSCLKLAGYLPKNVGAIARRFISDPELLRFIDIECYCWSVVPAAKTPMINAGMVFSDRHYGGVRYPKGGVGKIAETLAQGLEQCGGQIQYKARVTKILTNRGRAIGVQLANGQEYFAQRIISNATRWDTFDTLIDQSSNQNSSQNSTQNSTQNSNNQTSDQTSESQKLGGKFLPQRERKWRSRYQKSPSFFSLHLGVKADVIPPDTECHHIILEDWAKMEAAYGTLFVSIPTRLDPDLAPDNRHIFHVFTPSWMADWQGVSAREYEEKKKAIASQIIHRLDFTFPGFSTAIDYQEIGTPRTHRRFLGRVDGTYGPIPSRQLMGLLGMPFNRTAVPGLYCVGDSTFPGQGLNAVAFSGFACAHRVGVDLGL
ncbi:MAG: carotenoid isomerase [Leptolyngbyaceae cyanobacterium]